MEIIADLHMHSRYSRATSKNISIDTLEKYARIKGLNLIGTGDFQHHLWRKEIDEKLSEDENGILRTASGFPFLWQTEISLMYSQDGRRALHLVIFVPNSRVADKVTEYLGNKGRLDYDGRPIFGIPAKEFVSSLKAIDDKIEIIPAHCMTPWFGIFGSKTGFDNLKDCFQEQTKHIYAVESGISADPAMLWRFEDIASGKINVISSSDAHSYWPWRMGREATIFEIPELTYDNIIKAIRTGEGLKATIETPPEYGKYHWDGHRICKFSCNPKETQELKGICPVCKKSLIIGVDNRVEEISKHPKEFVPENSKPFHKLLPLHELISLDKGVGMSSGAVWKVYNELINDFGNEFNILLKVSREKLVQSSNEKLADLIMENRDGKIKVKPGFDGIYGVAILGEKQEKLV